MCGKDTCRADMELSRISDWRTWHGSGETKEKRSSESIPHKADPNRCGGSQQDKQKSYTSMNFFKTTRTRVRFTSSTETDPVGIVASAVQYIQSEELDLKNGDLAFCAVDTDTDMLKWGKMDRFDYTFDYTKRQCGAKPPFYAGFRLRKVIRVPCPPPYETEVSDPFRFFVFVGISMGTGCGELPSL